MRGEFHNVRAEMARRGLTYQKLADLCGYTSRAYTYQMVSGRVPASERFIQRLCEEWGLERDYLFATKGEHDA